MLQVSDPALNSVTELWVTKFNNLNKLSNVGEASKLLGLLMQGGESLGRREKLPQKVRRREKLAEKVGRREIYPPVPPPSLKS